MTTEPVGAESGPQGPEFPMIGRYRLLEQIGEGGMGVVHLALDSNGRAVAIKVLRPHVANDPGARARLAREVATLGRIRHPNVAPVLDADVDGPTPYLVTRYIAGPALDAVVAESGPLTGEALLRLGRGLAEALHVIHGNGVVHRDVKPGNVLLLDGQPVLIDFGIAHLDTDVRLTRTGLVMGTPGYLSPEIVEGADVSASTDWWGWAATLGFAASGRPPFGGGGLEPVLARVVRGDADLRGVDPALVPLLEAALSPAQQDRPTDAEVLAALDLYAAGGLVTNALRIVKRPLVAPTEALRIPATEALRSPATEALRIPATEALRSPPTAVIPLTPARSAPATLAGPPAAGPPARPPVASSPHPTPGYAAPPYAAPPARVPAGTPGYAVPAAGGPRGLAPSPAGPEAAYPGAQPSPGPVGPPLPPRPVMAGDPRIGRPTRSGTLLALGALFVALGAAAPWVALAAALAWSVVARASDRTVTSLVLRRHSRGPRPNDALMSVLASPLHLAAGIFASLTAALVPLIVGTAGVFAVRLAEPFYQGLSVRAGQCLGFGVGVALIVMMAWWGPGGAALRRGSRSMARGLAPNPVAAQFVAGLVLAATLAVVAWTLLGTSAPVWWPATDAPAIFDLLNNG